MQITDRKILQKAMEKARKNSVDYKYNPDIMILYTNCYAIIFDHAFAKAFWGEWECLYIEKQGIFPMPIESATQIRSGILIWQYHLQQMVLEKEPLKYIEKFLEIK
jgi:hypothetical protein